MSTFLCDDNIWLALALSGHVHHSVARGWLDTIDEHASILFCRSTQQALLRLLTNARVLATYGNAPLTNAAAWEVYEAFTRDDRIVLRIDEPAGLEARWKVLARRDDASTKLWMDAYLAAFTLTEGCRLVTTDHAFRQFDGLDALVLG